VYDAFGSQVVETVEQDWTTNIPDILVIAGDYDEGEAFFLPRKHDFRESLLFAKEHKLDYFDDFLEYSGKRSQVLVIKSARHSIRQRKSILSVDATRYRIAEWL